METNNNNDPAYEPVGEYVSIFQRGSRWYAYYRLNRKPVRQSLKTTSKKQARAKAAAIERDIINGEVNRPVRAPQIKDVIADYIAHLRAKPCAESTITKYQHALKLVVELAEKRGISRIDQINLAFVDAFRLDRVTHRYKRKRNDHAEGQTEDDPQ
jgi:hypothetical protein